MKILAITYCFAPLRFPATYRLLKWFKYLSEAGHEITVLSVDPASFSGPKDFGLTSLVPANLENITVKSRENTFLYRVLGKRRSWFLSLFEPFKREWYRPAWRVLRSLRARDYDVVFSCSQPPVCHLLGREMKKRTGLPWVAYFSDPWAENPYRAGTSARVRAYNRLLETRVIHSADTLIFSSEETVRLLRRRYSPATVAKAEVLDHCYVPEWFQRVKPSDTAARGPVRVLLTGNFYGPRTPLPLLRTLNDLDRRHRFSGRVLFEFYGAMTEESARDPIWTLARGFATFGGSVDYLTSLAKMRNADYLLLVDAPVENGKPSVFFPSKLAEYLGAGRPIIGLTPDNGTAARVLRETGNRVVDLSDDRGLAELLEGIAARRISVALDGESVRRYDYRSVGGRLEQILSVTISRVACGKEPIGEAR